MKTKNITSLLIIILAFSILPVLSVNFVSAQENITGTTIWYNWVEYYFEKTITVEENATLIIQEGTKVTFDKWRYASDYPYLVVKGKLVVESAQGRPVIFNGDIMFENSSINPFLKNMVINGSIYAYYAPLTVENCTIYANKYVSQSSTWLNRPLGIVTNANYDPLIKNNIIISVYPREGDGIKIMNGSGTVGEPLSESARAYIVGNTILNFDMAIESYGDAYFANNLIYNNSYFISAEYPNYKYSRTGTYYPKYEIRNNTIVYNTYVIHRNDVRKHILDTVEFNNIHDNKHHMGIGLLEPSNISYPNNWWGSGIKRLIEDQVSKYINIDPILTEPNRHAPAVPEQYTGRPSPSPSPTETVMPTETVCPIETPVNPTVTPTGSCTSIPTVTPSQSLEPVGTNKDNDIYMYIIIGLVVALIILIAIILLFIFKKYTVGTFSP